jgi:hypothetical protein
MSRNNDHGRAYNYDYWERSYFSHLIKLFYSVFDYYPETKEDYYVFESFNKFIWQQSSGLISSFLEETLSPVEETFYETYLTYKNSTD